MSDPEQCPCLCAYVDVRETVNVLSPWATSECFVVACIDCSRESKEQATRELAVRSWNEMVAAERADMGILREAIEKLEGR